MSPDTSNSAYIPCVVFSTTRDAYHDEGISLKDRLNEKSISGQLI